MRMQYRASGRWPQHAAALAAMTHLAAAMAQGAPTQRVDVIGTSPLPGQGVDRDALPYGTQVIRRAAFESAQPDNTVDYLGRRMAGAQVHDIQGSPFQGDLTYRGYRASAILGASQGVSVFIDGVRINEPFGDVVNWDMVPEFAIQILTLTPGANPAFGLNTLGGALAFTTATGASAPGLRGEASVGRFGRRKLEIAHGGTHEGGWSHFVGAGLFDETGWRDHSDGHLGTVVAKLGAHTTLGDISLGLLAGRSSLVGNGLVPLVTLDDDGSTTPDLASNDRAAVYTHPDLTRNQLTQLTGQWVRDLGEQTLLETLVYLRDSRRTTINGDEAEEATIEANATFNRTATRQRSGGLAAALSHRRGGHQWQVGAALDHAQVSYEQTEREGVFDVTRGVLPVDGHDAELSATVSGQSSSLGLYATGTWQVAPGTHLTGTLRWNQAQVSNTLSSQDDDSGEFEVHPKESFTYRSWNPALGIAYKFSPAFTLFANTARNNRVPTVIELGCADPGEPCRLPAGLQADPYLEQVITSSIEAGARVVLPGGARGSLTYFRNVNRNDILFRSVSVTGQLGYFANFPKTRHQGVDLEWQAGVGPLELGLAYSHLDATYQADGVLRMGDRNVAVAPGTRISGLPRHVLKASADWSPGPGVTLGADVQALASRGVAGNEDGLLEDDGDEQVRLRLPGYAVVNLRASWKPESWKGLELYARATNIGNRRYASFGALAETQFDAHGNYTGQDSEALFVAPGAPRAVAVGLRWKF